MENLRKTLPSTLPRLSKPQLKALEAVKTAKCLRLDNTSTVKWSTAASLDKLGLCVIVWDNGNHWGPAALEMRYSPWARCFSRGHWKDDTFVQPAWDAKVAGITEILDGQEKVDEMRLAYVEHLSDMARLLVEATSAVKDEYNRATGLAYMYQR